MTDTYLESGVEVHLSYESAEAWAIQVCQELHERRWIVSLVCRPGHWVVTSRPPLFRPAGMKAYQVDEQGRVGHA